MRRSAVLAALALACAVLPQGVGPASAAAPPVSCAEAALSNPVDGPVTLVVGTVAVPVWCADMTTTPVEYLTLSRTAAGQNQSFSPAGGRYPGTDVTVRWQRVRLLLPTPSRSSFGIDASDMRFATVTGARTDSGTGAPINPPWFATAGQCALSPVGPGTTEADLRDTPFAVSRGQFAVYGSGASGTSTYSSTDQVYDATGRGYCGVMGLNLYENGRPVVLLSLVPSLPVVVVQPTAVTAAAGTPTSFSSTATGAAVVSTRWQTSTDAGATWVDVPGATGTTASLTAPSTPGTAVLVRALHSTSAGDTASAAVALQSAVPPVPAPAPTPAPAPAPTGLELAATGVDPTPALGLGVLLLVTGVGVLVGQRWRTTAGSAPTARSACVSSAPSGPSATV